MQKSYKISRPGDISVGVKAETFGRNLKGCCCKYFNHNTLIILISTNIISVYKMLFIVAINAIYTNIYLYIYIYRMLQKTEP